MVKWLDTKNSVYKREQQSTCESHQGNGPYWFHEFVKREISRYPKLQISINGTM